MDVNPPAAPVVAPSEIKAETGLEQGVKDVVGGVEGGVAGGVAGGIVRPRGAAAPAPAAASAATAAPVRVGGNIKPPTKTKDVKPTYPPIAQSARVQGVVIIEATIGPDGRCKRRKCCGRFPCSTRRRSTP